jgi:hypothetical protein
MFMLRWDMYGYDKKRARTHYAELVFLHPMGSAGHVMHSGASGARNIDALFFMFWWDPYRYDKKRFGTRYAKHVFLHSMGSAGHIVHSGASGAQNVDALFLMFRWDRYGYDEKRVGTRCAEIVFFASDRICGSRSAFWCIWGTKHRCSLFHARVSSVQFP